MITRQRGAQHGACYGERIELVLGTMHPRHRQPTRTELQLLKNENDGLRTEIVRLRRELENREGAVGRLELLLRERLTKIDELTAQVDQLREANKRLDAEAEHWALRYAEECPDRRVAVQAQPSLERPVSPNRGPSPLLAACRDGTRVLGYLLTGRASRAERG